MRETTKRHVTVRIASKNNQNASVKLMQTNTSQAGNSCHVTDSRVRKKRVESYTLIQSQTHANTFNHAHMQAACRTRLAGRQIENLRKACFCSQTNKRGFWRQSPRRLGLILLQVSRRRSNPLFHHEKCGHSPQTDVVVFTGRCVNACAWIALKHEMQ